MKFNYLLLVGSLKKGGAERNTAILANHLVSRGHAVTIALFIRNIAFELDPRVNIVHVDHKRYTSKVLSALYVIANVRKLVRTLRPKRLIAMSRIGSLLATCVLFRHTVTRFDIYPLIGYKKYKQWQFWFFYNMPWVKYVVCPSEELKEDVTRFFLNKRKLVTIYNPVPLPKKNAEQASELPESRTYFAIVSRLSRQKNVAQVIEAYHRFRIFERADLVILGDGSEMLHLKALIRKLELTDYVKLKGFIGDPHPYMVNAVALINASLREGFPNVVVEALSLGTPVISSLAKTGPKEIIFHGDNGYLFPVGDYEKMGEAMTELLVNKDLYAHLKRNVTKGLDRFTQEKVMNSWEKILIN
ncbi:glycosyltransferase [Ohtaekwangia koreensis]|jgi:GalNAc-alpha-(1->4)-GalNAc-alpha-(1->3)-diNAcBac-PP-undecaprenol alpha-1,4-N-acetyl-D-galactosaminyltransferase|uniref:Glycosyltransferase involved in cell wall bisynthesis n=1 Tax=Ohtaekwangia koreensis TaxID=688867 RepID=A0A1T5M481_9BACT|nr:glycosyltransferase [Ohtaekwangia koreensis]SKC82996.1 Glycosyltransferase involved in cell wall bisynthesis [Ohtaekwangia koreensis]